jgi:hypothetical protein
VILMKMRSPMARGHQPAQEDGFSSSKAEDLIDQSGDWVLDKFLVGVIEAMRQDADWILKMADKQTGTEGNSRF